MISEKNNSMAVTKSKVENTVKNLAARSMDLQTSSQERETALAILETIPANLPYPDWFRVAAALKNAGVDFEAFDAWSATAPEKYEEDKAEKVWEDGRLRREQTGNYSRKPSFHCSTVQRNDYTPARDVIGSHNHRRTGAAGWNLH